MWRLATTCLRLASKNLAAHPKLVIVHISIVALSVAACSGIRSSAIAFSAELDRRQHIALAEIFQSKAEQISTLLNGLRSNDLQPQAAGGPSPPSPFSM